MTRYRQKVELVDVEPIGATPGELLARRLGFTHRLKFSNGSEMCTTEVEFLRDYEPIPEEPAPEPAPTPHEVAKLLYPHGGTDNVTRADYAYALEVLTSLCEEVEREALERAAKVAVRVAGPHNYGTGELIAAAIRELIPSKPEGGKGLSDKTLGSVVDLMAALSARDKDVARLRKALIDVDAANSHSGPGSHCTCSQTTRTRIISAALRPR